ncbi:MAG: hypothetical protein KDA88_11300 [Planctomycetaceae bacterium]|nr:hypothetical protein [Planctomycetaceae bacterium]MCB9953776.1 hypothetical protein [Planctomycetaceae bacterium]
MFILSLILGLVAVSVWCIPFALPIWFFNKSNARWVPASTKRDSVVVRHEVATILVILLVWGGVMSLSGFGTAPLSVKFLDEGLSETTRSYYRWATVAGVSLALVGLVTAWRYSTTYAVAGLLALGLGGGAALQSALSEQQIWEWTQRHSRGESDKSEKLPTTFRFQLVDNIEGADLWINGVYMGKTPYETTDIELLAKVEPWEHEARREAEKMGGDERVVYHTPQGQELTQWGWCPLHLHGSHDSSNMYYRVELNGVSGYSHVSSQESVGPTNSPDWVRLMTLDTVFPAWENSIEELLDRARMNNYEVDAEWWDAFESHGSFANQRLNNALREEPQLRKILMQRAERTVQLDSVTDAASAWRALMEIEAQVSQAHEYHSESDLGLAVDFLVPFLDEEQLVNYALAAMKRWPRADLGSTMWTATGFGTYGTGGTSHGTFGGSVHGEEVGAWPIAHAVWRLDQRLDAATGPASIQGDAHGPLETWIDPNADNLVERRITPELIKLSRENSNAIRYAGVLGGSAYEHFLIHHNWREPATDPFDGNVRIGTSEVYMNGWFQKLAMLDSPLGAEFRRQQSDKLLDIARDAVDENSMWAWSIPDGLDYLFVDFGSTVAPQVNYGGSTPSLAMQFWPKFDGMMHAVPERRQQETLRGRWTYLARMWPESTVEMFAKSFAEAAENQDFTFAPNFPEDFPPSEQFRILSGVIELEEQRVSTLREDPEEQRYNGPKYRAQLGISRLKERRSELPCVESAELLVTEMTADPKHSWRGRLHDFLNNDRQHEDLLRLITNTGGAELQKQIIPALENHPIPSRRELLRKLALHEELRNLDASLEDSVVGDARAAEARLEALEAKPLAEMRRTELVAPQSDEGQSEDADGNAVSGE